MPAHRFLFAAIFAFAAQAQTWKLDSITGLQVTGLKLEAVSYQGKRAVRVQDPTGMTASQSPLAAIGGSDFEDGTIEVEVAGAPGPGADAAARGFIGIAFRVQDGTHFECFYIRPTNGRADDQLRRNHSVQYVSEPEFGWQRLRTESPGVYESYADLVPGAWTKLRIEVSGVRAKLYVNGAEQPCLIVNDLKKGKSRGKIALWIGPGTDGYFSNLTAKK